MMSYGDSLLFWSVAVLLGIIAFMIIGGTWVSIRSWWINRGDDGPIPPALPDNELAVYVEQDQAESENAIDLIDEDALPEVDYLRRTSPGRLPD